MFLWNKVNIVHYCVVEKKGKLSPENMVQDLQGRRGGEWSLKLTFHLWQLWALASKGLFFIILLILICCDIYNVCMSACVLVFGSCILFLFYLIHFPRECWWQTMHRNRKFMVVRVINHCLVIRLQLCISILIFRMFFWSWKIA